MPVTRRLYHANRAMLDANTLTEMMLVKKNVL
jgi:hypothetical protein